MDIEERKKIEKFLEDLEERHKPGPIPDPEKQHMLDVVKDNDNGRNQLLHELFESMNMIMFMPPVDFVKYLVLDLAKPNLSRELIMNKLSGFQIDDDIKDRISKQADAMDKRRMLGLKKLQAFVKIRPLLIKAMEDLGVDTSIYPK